MVGVSASWVILVSEKSDLVPERADVEKKNSNWRWSQTLQSMIDLSIFDQSEISEFLHH